MENLNIKISVSMIVKNEKALLSRCLESVKEADEIIIVDTGSVDETIEIAKQYTDNIHNLQWCDDFSLARNFAKSKCTGDFILSIDADEFLEEDGINKIKGYLLNVNKKDVVGLKMKSNNQEYFVPRLFRNSKDIFFNGRIHEALNVTDCDKLNVSINFGTSPAHSLDPDRNFRILNECVEKEPCSTRYLYYLGREYGYKKDWQKTIEILERYILLATWLPEKADAFFMLGVAYWNIGEGEKARVNCLMAMNINANFKAPILLMAHMSFEKNSNQWKKMGETATNEETLFARQNFGII